ncbi:hypothetical protein [Mycolicibacterium phlei]
MKRVAALVAVAALLLTVACGSKTRPPDPELIRSATEFAGIVLPASAEVLEAHQDSRLDTRYQLALRVPTADLDTLLAESHFTEPLTRTKSPEVVSAQDRYRNADGMWVYRNVMVNEREPDVRFVHLELFTT